MHEVKVNAKGKEYLKWVEGRSRTRGIWVPIGRADERGIEELVSRNQGLGLKVLIDEKGVYRALVCKD